MPGAIEALLAFGGPAETRTPSAAIAEACDTTGSVPASSKAAVIEARAILKRSVDDPARRAMERCRKEHFADAPAARDWYDRVVKGGAKAHGGEREMKGRREALTILAKCVPEFARFVPELVH